MVNVCVKFSLKCMDEVRTDVRMHTHILKPNPRCDIYGELSASGRDKIDVTNHILFLYYLLFLLDEDIKNNNYFSPQTIYIGLK